MQFAFFHHPAPPTAPEQRGCSTIREKYKEYGICQIIRKNFVSFSRLVPWHLHLLWISPLNLILQILNLLKKTKTQILKRIFCGGKITKIWHFVAQGKMEALSDHNLNDNGNIWVYLLIWKGNRPPVKIQFTKSDCNACCLYWALHGVSLLSTRAGQTRVSAIQKFHCQCPPSSGIN